MSSGVGSLCSSIGVDGGTAGGVDNGVRSEDEEKGGGVSQQRAQMGHYSAYGMDLRRLKVQNTPHSHSSLLIS